MKSSAGDGESSLDSSQIQRKAHALAETRLDRTEDFKAVGANSHVQQARLRTGGGQEGPLSQFLASPKRGQLPR